MITNLKDLRKLFWLEHPGLSRRKIKDYSGNGKMYCTDTRCAFVDWLDAMEKSGQLKEGLAERATL